MNNPDFFNEQSAADYLDALSDIASELEDAMRESNQSDWDGIAEISSTEINVHLHTNERYVKHDHH